MFLELGLRMRIGPFDIKNDDDIVKRVMLDLPEDVPPGTYTARITISDSYGDVRRVRHRDITIQ